MMEITPPSQRIFFEVELKPPCHLTTENVVKYHIKSILITDSLYNKNISHSWYEWKYMGYKKWTFIQPISRWWGRCRQIPI